MELDNCPFIQIVYSVCNVNDVEQALPEADVQLGTKATRASYVGNI